MSLINTNREPYIKLDVPPMGQGLPQEEVQIEGFSYRHLSRGIYVPYDATPEDMGAAFGFWLQEGYEQAATWSYPITRRALSVCGYLGGRALDLGMGSGLSAEALVDHGVPASMITGYDVSPQMLEVARRKPKLQGASIVEGDMTVTLESEVPRGDVELAISIFALSNLPLESWDIALRAVGRHLSPHGVLAVAEGTNSRSGKLAKHMAENYGAYDYVHQHTQNDGRTVDVHLLFASRQQLALGHNSTPTGLRQ